MAQTMTDEDQKMALAKKLKMPPLVTGSALQRGAGAGAPPPSAWSGVGTVAVPPDAPSPQAVPAAYTNAGSNRPDAAGPVPAVVGSAVAAKPKPGYVGGGGLVPYANQTSAPGLSNSPLIDVINNHQAVSAQATQSQTPAPPQSTDRVGPPDSANDAYKQVLAEQNRRHINNARLRALSSTPAQYGGDNNARIADIHALQDQTEKYNLARSTPQKVQDAGTIAAGHNDLKEQGLKMASDQIAKAQADADRAQQTGDTALLQDAQKRLREGLGLRDRFSQWQPMTDEAAAASHASQEKTNLAQSLRKQRAQNAVNAEVERQLEGQGYQQEGARLGAQIGNAALSAKLAELKLREQLAGAANNPEALKAKVMADINRAKTEQAVTGAEATKATTSANYENRVAPLTDPEYIKATARLSSAIAKFGPRAYLGADRAGDVDQFENDVKAVQLIISAMAPEQQAAAKRDLAASLNTSGIGTERAPFSDRAGEFIDNIVPGQSVDKRNVNTARWRKATESLRQYIKT